MTALCGKLLVRSDSCSAHQSGSSIPSAPHRMTHIYRHANRAVEVKARTRWEVKAWAEEERESQHRSPLSRAGLIYF